jgi:serine/threonine protein kinase
VSDDPKPLGNTKVADLPEPPPEEFPRPFGNYLLLAPLARGGMGEVFLAKHGSVAGLEKHCVVKTLRPHLTDDREYTSRFIDEARIVVQLGHRNICHVFDVGVVGERYYLAMEYIAGKDLRALSGDAPGGVINAGLAIHVVSEVLEALDYAHRQTDASSGVPLQLVHRDVSPQNVMLSWEGEVKLIDFGLAASTLKVEQTSPNVVMGKLAYMAPEQVRGEKVDGRADLFAAGVMMYELVAGERFYEGRSPYEIWGIAAQGGYRPRGWPVIDDDMKAILDRALAGTPATRYATCIEMREALQSYMQARALRGDAPMLRSLMQTVYSTAIDESRRQLQTLSKAKIPARFAGGSTSGPNAGFPVLSLESTQSIARSPSASIENKRLLAASVGEGTEPTEMHLKPSTWGPRKTPVAAAAVVLVAIAAVVAVFASRMDDKPGPVANAIVDAGAAAPTVADAGSAPIAALVVDAGRQQVEPEVVVDEPEREPVVKKKDRKGKKEKIEPKEETKTDVKVEPKVEEPKTDAPPSYRATKGWPSRVDVLMARCPAQACTKDVAKHRSDFGSLGVDGTKEWTQAIEACWKTCGLPP